MDALRIRGAREHNLKNIELDIPRNRLVVITGVSGSGKSTLAFDTLFAEGQRRYVESLSAYARQFLEQMEKPDVDTIEGLSPAISIEQQTTSKNPRSTVATVTEIYDYLRLLYASIGKPHCPKCGSPIQAQTAQQMVDRRPAAGRHPVPAAGADVSGKKGEYRKPMAEMRKEGFLRARMDGQLYDLEPAGPRQAAEAHDRGRRGPAARRAPRRGLRQAPRRLAGDGAPGLGRASSRSPSPTAPRKFLSANYACPDCGTSLAEITPRLFSFNSPHGACPPARARHVLKVDPERLVVDSGKSIAAGAIAVLKPARRWRWRQMPTLAKH